MLTKSKDYDRVIFSPEVINAAVDVIAINLPEEQSDLTRMTLHIELPSGEEWTHDNENEFFADYRKDFVHAVFEKSFGNWAATIEITAWNRPQRLPTHTNVRVRMPNRVDVERVFEVIESNVEKCRLPAPPRKRRPKSTKPPKPNVRIFVGHGQSPLWRDLKDHLHEKHSMSVEAYEERDL